MKPAYLWLDTETTGLNVSRCRLLEVGAIIVSSDLEVISTFKRVLHFRRIDAPHVAIDAKVHGMHWDNGLWDDCERSDMTPTEVDHELLAWTLSFFKRGEATLGGKSIWFDRDVAKLHLPEFSGVLHCKQLDTNTLIEANRILGLPAIERHPHPHRALDDALGDLADARALVKQMGVGYVLPPGAVGVESVGCGCVDHCP